MSIAPGHRRKFPLVAARGTRFIANGDALFAKPRAKLIDVDRMVIRERKAEILARLRDEPQPKGLPDSKYASRLHASRLPPADASAYSIVQTCRGYGVRL